MKKFLATVLAMLLVLTAASCALAELDYSMVYENEGEIFTLDIQEEDGKSFAFIESTLDTKARSFVHKYESSTRYSSTEFDILVVDYLGEDEYPIFRLWITYCEDNAFLEIDSVTFTLDGYDYTFFSASEEDWKVKDEKGCLEQTLIKFDLDNLEFLSVLENLTPDTYEEIENIHIKMTLHGREDIEVDLGEGFFLDFLLVKTAYTNINGLAYIGDVNGTLMKKDAAN